MPNIETYFLVDFENVKEAGLVCSDKLTEHDHIHIFSTQNNPKINFNILAPLNKADLNIHVVPSGKQSLDMHLAFFISTNPSRYLIILKKVKSAFIHPCKNSSSYHYSY